jgi:Domain of unknown function (DUF4177)
VWTYKVDDSAKSPHELERLMNERAADGWRVISVLHSANAVSQSVIVLEREVLGE